MYVSLRLSYGTGPAKSIWISLFDSSSVGNSHVMFLEVIGFKFFPIFMQDDHLGVSVTFSPFILRNQIMLAKQTCRLVQDDSYR